MGAMPEEIAPILEIVGDYTITEYADNTYYETTYKGTELVIAYSKIGKVFSTLTASTMIQHFECTKLLFSGVAGGIKGLFDEGIVGEGKQNSGTNYDDFISRPGENPMSFNSNDTLIGAKKDGPIDKLLNNFSFFILLL